MYASFLATQPVYDFSGAEKMASACKKGSLSGGRIFWSIT
tara:strand:+ start:1329 stop:1448 length:120 start_codon:yes stop_codon:yes gene_type:complete